MTKTFTSDILIQTDDPIAAAKFYVANLQFQITGETPEMISLEGKAINLYIERGPALGPILEVMVSDVDETKKKLMATGCKVVKDEPNFPRCYVTDPFGLTYNLRASGS